MTTYKVNVQYGKDMTALHERVRAPDIEAAIRQVVQRDFEMGSPMQFSHATDLEAACQVDGVLGFVHAVKVTPGTLSGGETDGAGDVLDKVRDCLARIAPLARRAIALMEALRNAGSRDYADALAVIEQATLKECTKPDSISEAIAFCDKAK